MHTVNTLQQEILKMKKDKDVAILAHSYQTHDILEVADVTGDSFQLSVAASKLPQKTVILCGVRFMAETVKLLSPDKTVFLSHKDAGCPMAEQMTREDIAAWRDAHPDHAVVAYINTTTALKTVCDVCVTSSSAVKIVSRMPQKDILFIPDCNLGSFVKASCPDKNITLLQGGCPVHSAITAEEAKAAKAAHPNALLLCHPECLPAVSEQADYLGSTADIMRFARESTHDEFIIGTENAILDHLQYECPDKHFYPLSKRLICPDMKLTTLNDLYHILNGQGGEEILLDTDTATAAKACIDRMLELG